MVSQVRAKMKCHEAPTDPDKIRSEDVYKIRLGAVYEPDTDKRMSSENAIFGKYTPWGEIMMGIANPAAKDFFKPGKTYYVDFTEAPE